MYVNSAIRFRDPFSSKDPPSSSAAHTTHRSTPSWSSLHHHLDINRALTPPPEMNVADSTTSQPSHNCKEYGTGFGDYIPAQHAYRAPVTTYAPQEPSQNHTHGRDGVVSAGNGRVSPVRQPATEATITQTQQRRSSHNNAIATNFQIPRSVNDSGGSLSELAAQITCLFWFESSDLLQQIEDSLSPLQPTRSLVADAKPTTGFRKWVTTILSTTMVAQNVVLLALLFVYRLKKLNPTVRGKPGSEYRLLTVALMLGNKFLDDNTYTNKTWAEVSGINVAEVHIMEVEFLSNMKYCLFTSERDWARWQSLLGKFAYFFGRAARPQPPAPILPPASSIHLPLALPSPPASSQASPPYPIELAQNGMVSQPNAGQYGPTPVPSPLGHFDFQATQPASRKRSLADDHGAEPPPKRLATGYQGHVSPNRYGNLQPQQNQVQSAPRLTLPSLANHTALGTGSGLPPVSQSQQLPPLSVPQRAMGLVYPSIAAQGTASPYSQSTGTSPSSAVLQPATILHPAAQISPTYFLQQRNSPYRPVNPVSTLLYPPSSAAIQARPQNIELSQMQYQPLGKPIHHSGRLPYLGQNLYLDGNHPQEMTPVHQWPNFPAQQQQTTQLNHQH